jgi:hypothetical protein
MRKNTLQTNKQPYHISPLLGGAVGAIVGGVLGSIIASMMNNPALRKQIEAASQNIADAALHTLREINKKPNGVQTIAKHVVDDQIETLSKKYLSN